MTSPRMLDAVREQSTAALSLREDAVDVAAASSALSPFDLK